MSKFKIGDWIRDKVSGEIFQHKENCRVSAEFQEKYWELWQPREGEFIIHENFSKSSTDSFEVIKWKEGYTFKYEPFIGMLPSFLQGK